MTKTRSSSARRIAAIEAAISAKPMTANEIAAAIYLCRNNIGRYLAQLRQAPKRVYVADWCDRCHQPTPVYAWGDAEDAPRPTSATRDAARASALVNT